MNDRGVRARASLYRSILGTVIATIKRHGNQVNFRQFSLYFFNCVQEHMDHHGEQYYYEAKVRPVSDIMPAVTRDVGQRQASDAAHEILRSPGGRRRRDSGGSEADLFSTCNRRAGTAQNGSNCSQTFAVRAKSGLHFSNQNPATRADSRDS